MAVEIWPLRVLDLSEGLAGAYCTKLLCDLGADVIKIEPTHGDPLRRRVACGAELAEGEDAALFEFLSAGKRSRVLDLATQRGRDPLHELAGAADVVVAGDAEGSPSSALAELLFEEHAHLVVLFLSPFGGGGPHSDRPAVDLTVQAWSGNTANRGLPGRTPVMAGADFSLWCAGSFAALAVAANAYQSQRTGEGVYLDLSSLESMMLAGGMAAIESQMNHNYRARPAEIEVPANEPASDGYVGFTTVTAQQWSDFCNMIGEPGWISDPDYMTMSGRSQRIGAVRARIAQWTKAHTVAEIVELASLYRIPVSPVENGATLPANEHVRERGMLVRSARSGFLQPRSPFRFAGLPDGDPAPAPRLDEHPEASWPKRAEHAPRKHATQERPLAGLRVADLTAFWAGPYATALLALLGAEVIHVESVTRPDGMRFRSERAPSEPDWWEWGAQFQGVNGSKLGITLDLSSADGIRLLRRVLEQCDMLVENFSPRVLENFGLNAEALRRINPELIVARMPAFGLDGPWRDRVGFAQTLEQLTGLAHVTGYADDGPICPRGLCDPLAAIHTALAAIGGLKLREARGSGGVIEVSMLDMAANVASEQLVEHSAYGRLLTRNGNRSWRATQGVYACKAEERTATVAISACSEQEWRGLCQAIGRPDWVTDADFASPAARQARHDEIDAAISAWTAGHAAAEIVDELWSRSVAVAIVDSPHWNRRNEQIEARGFFSEVAHPICGPLAYPGLPYRHRRPGGPWVAGGQHRSAAPTLGQHNGHVLCGLAKLSAAEFSELQRAGAIGTVPHGLATGKPM